MKAFWKLTWTEMKLFVREPIGLFFTLLFPLLLLVIFGSIFGNDSTGMFGGFGSVDNSVPGYMGMIIGTLGLIGLPVSLASCSLRPWRHVAGNSASSAATGPHR